MSTNRLRTWGRDYAGVLSAVGALVIFFSWAVTTTFADRYNHLKQGVEAAQANFRLYTTLHELRDQLNSIAMEVVQAKTGPDASRLASGRTGQAGTDGIRREFDLTRLSAHQVKELMDFAVETNSLSRAADTATDASREIDKVRAQIEPVYFRLLALERDAEQELTQRAAASGIRESGSTAVDGYLAYVRAEAIPKVGPLYQRIVEVSNARRREAEAELNKARANADLSGTMALFLYVLGSLLALGGQYFDKIDKRKAAAPESEL